MADFGCSSPGTSQPRAAEGSVEQSVSQQGQTKLKKNPQSASIPCRKLSQLSCPQDAGPSRSSSSSRGSQVCPLPPEQRGAAAGQPSKGRSTEGMFRWKWERGEGKKMGEVPTLHCVKGHIELRWFGAVPVCPHNIYALVSRVSLVREGKGTRLGKTGRVGLVLRFKGEEWLGWRKRKRRNLNPHPLPHPLLKTMVLLRGKNVNALFSSRSFLKYKPRTS